MIESDCVCLNIKPKKKMHKRGVKDVNYPKKIELLCQNILKESAK